jgi:hypothetical protein
VLIAACTALFVVPDLAGGHLLMAGDNVQQNYPLHVLVGNMLRHGELPYWNQYIFSGTPLLAGFNAGAFYPLVGFFVVLPDRAAWIATEATLFSLIAVGMYAYLRVLKLSVAACFLAACTFTFAGTVFSQINHLDMTEGFAALPWMLLALHRIVHDGRWRWTLLLAVAFATMVLGGAPEAMLDVTLLLVAYAALSAGVDRVRWWRLLSRAGAGIALGLSVAAVQWLPGLAAIANSQRSGFGASFASTGSYPKPFLFFSVVPYLFGGYHHLGENGFFSHYNLPEVGIYLGILPIVALVTLLHPRWPSRLPGRERRIWYLVGLFGLLLALGANTPAEHLFNSLPLYGHQRLQSRNMITVSAALCVLFAGWVDRRPEARTTLRHFDAAASALPLAVVGALTIWAQVAPSSILFTLGSVTSPSGGEIHTVRVATLMALAFCAVATVVVTLRGRLSQRWWMAAITVFVAVDVGLIAATSQISSAPSNAILGGHTDIEQAIAAHLVPDGRFVVYDPQGYASGSHDAAGISDLNLLAKLPSVAGYASIVNGTYATVTNTHTLGELNIKQLGSGSLDGLDLQEVVTVPEYFMVPVVGTPLARSQITQLSEGAGSDPVLPLGNGANFNDQTYPFYPGPRAALSAGQHTAWFFGETVQPTSASLLFAHAAALAVVRFGSVSSDGVTTWGPAVKVPAGATGVTGELPAVSGVGMTAQVIFGALPRAIGLVTIAGHAFELGGSLSSVVSPATWRSAGTIDGYGLFTRRKLPQPIYAVTVQGKRGPALDVRGSFIKSETVQVRASTSLIIVRDVAWDPGWGGTVRVNGGRSQAVAVTHHGLVQQMVVPAGDDVVTFSYAPPHIELAGALSTGGVIVVVVLGLALLLRRRRTDTQIPTGHEDDAGAGPDE